MTRKFGKNTWKPGKERKDGAILIPIERGQNLPRDGIDVYCRTMVDEILKTMTLTGDWIFSINFIHTFRFSVLMLNDFWGGGETWKKEAA